jgi:hypothetical protein
VNIPVVHEDNCLGDSFEEIFHSKSFQKQEMDMISSNHVESVLIKWFVEFRSLFMLYLSCYHFVLHHSFLHIVFRADFNDLYWGDSDLFFKGWSKEILIKLALFLYKIFWVRIIIHSKILSSNLAIHPRRYLYWLEDFEPNDCILFHFFNKMILIHFEWMILQRVDERDIFWGSRRTLNESHKNTSLRARMIDAFKSFYAEYYLYSETYRWRKKMWLKEHFGEPGFPIFFSFKSQGSITSLNQNI